MKNRKKVISFVLTLMLVLGLVPMGLGGGVGEVYAAGPSIYTDGDGNEYTYSISGGEATITHFINISGSSIVIPNILGACPVTTIGAYAFETNSFTSVTIPNTVKNISNDAFYYCRNLASVIITSTEASPSALTTIEESAFEDCYNLTNINIPSSLTFIGANAFMGCEDLSSVTFPEGLATIGESAFEDCWSLTSITITGITVVESSAFEGCSKITNVVLPTSMTAINQYVFRDCHNLTYITIPSSVTSIGYGTFENCAHLNQIVLPDGLTSIGGDAFSGCDSLTTIIIPSSVTTIGDWAFYECEDLTGITVAALNANYSNDANGVLFNKDKSLLIVYPEGNSASSYEIPNTVKEIDEDAFYYSYSLVSITIPTGVTTIGAYAFNYCTSLEAITIPSGVTTIDEYTFEGCESLTSITIPDSITFIGEGVFGDCTSLEDIIIPKGVTTIGAYAFDGCESLTSITISAVEVTIDSDAFYGCSSLNTAYFKGKDPGYDPSIFEDAAEGFTIYYLKGTTGWTTTTWGSIDYNYPCYPYGAEGSSDPVLSHHHHAMVPLVVSPAISNIMRFKINLTNSYVKTGDTAEVIHPMDVAPILFENRTLLPIRFVVEPLGGKAIWSPTERKVTIERGDQIIELWIGNNVAKVNGIDKVIDPNNNLVKPMIVNPGRMMLPLRFISEALGCTVDWDAVNKEIVVSNW